MAARTLIQPRGSVRRKSGVEPPHSNGARLPALSDGRQKAAATTARKTNVSLNG